jgi:hypothetical protein
VTDDLPTARNTLPKDAWLCLFVWCKACFHRGPVDLQAIIDAGQGDKPLKDSALPLCQVRQPHDRQRDDGQGQRRRAAVAQ